MGGGNGSRPSLGSISFIFMQFLAKLFPNNKLALPPELALCVCVCVNMN